MQCLQMHSQSGVQFLGFPFPCCSSSWVTLSTYLYADRRYYPALYGGRSIESNRKNSQARSHRGVPWVLKNASIDQFALTEEVNSVPRLRPKRLSLLDSLPKCHHRSILRVIISNRFTNTLYCALSNSPTSQKPSHSPTTEGSWHPATRWPGRQ